MYESNLKREMSQDDAYSEAYSVICNKYNDADIDRELDGKIVRRGVPLLN